LTPAWVIAVVKNRVSDSRREVSESARDGQEDLTDRGKLGEKASGEIIIARFALQEELEELSLLAWMVKERRMSVIGWRERGMSVDGSRGRLLRFSEDGSDPVVRVHLQSHRNIA
jgi:hypothetical protein